MKLCPKTVVFGIAAILVSSTLCVNPSHHAGNGSDVGNGMIIGILLNPDGKTAATGAKVSLRKKWSIADTTGILAKKDALADTATALTDENGKFVIDSVDTGIYVVEGSDGNNNLAFNDSIYIADPDTTIILPPDTLKPAGVVKGVIRLSEGGDPRNVFILAFGIDRFSRVSSDGSFKFNNLAEGKYDLRLISSLDDYGVLDTMNIPVISADTTDMDTIELPFTGIPTPKIVIISYDTLKQIVTLTWSRPDFSLVKSFNVYRRNVDSNSVLKQVNTSPITDTLYRDSTGIQDQTYEYRIACVDMNETEGTKCAGVSVKVVSKFALNDSIGSFGTAAGQFTYIWDMTCDKNGNLYVVSCESDTGKYPSVQQFNENKNSIYSIGIKGIDSLQFRFPKGVAVDNKNWIYVTDIGHARVQIFDSTGALIRSIYGQNSDSSRLLCPKEIAVDDSTIYVGDYSNNDNYSIVKKFDLNGNFLQKWGSKGDSPGQFKMIWSIKVTSTGELAILDENGIQFFSKQGTFIKRVVNSSYGLIKDIDINNKIIYSVTYEGNVILFDESGVFIGKYDSRKKDLFQVTSDGSNIFLHYFESGKIRVLNKRD